MDTLFIQFYSKTSLHGQGYTHGYDLQNGFSDTYDFCKNMGDFFWVYLDKNIEDVAYTPLPINKGTVYISAAYFSHLYQSYLWAKEYPNIKFVVGGPVVSADLFYVDKLPKNMKLISTSVERYFRIPEFGHPWKIDIPERIPNGSCVMFVYTLDTNCYWKKCVFCPYSKDLYRRKRKTFNYEFADVRFNGSMLVRLGTEALSSDMIKSLSLPPVNGGYRAFLRPCKHELEALRSLDSFPIKWFSMGLEYPTKRMWKYMNKGYKRSDVLDTIHFLAERQIHITPSIILGWDNLTENDVDELERFMNDLPMLNNNTIAIHKLMVIPNTKLYKTHSGPDIKYGPFVYGYYPTLNDKQIELNKQSKDIVEKYVKEKGMTLLWTCDFQGE